MNQGWPNSVVSQFQFSSVRFLCALCVFCGELIAANIHHRDTEVTKDAQRFQVAIITGLMLLGNGYLLCWDYDKLKRLV